MSNNMIRLKISILNQDNDFKLKFNSKKINKKSINNIIRENNN